MRRGERDVKDSGSEIGYIVGESTSDYLTFVAPSDIPLKKWDFVSVFIEEKEFLGRIEKVLSRSELLNEDLGYESTRKYVSRGMFDELLLCRARLLGSLVNNEIVTPRNIIKPGTVVYRTSETSLKEFFGFPEDRALLIGNLIDHDDVPVSIDVSGLRRHLAILAQTGAGKSNVAAVIMEELLEKGASIIVLDPHADYVLMRKKSNGSFMPGSIRIFRTPLSTGRYEKENKGFVDHFTINFADLDLDSLCDIMDIREEWTNLRKIVEGIMKIPGAMRDLASFMKATEQIPQDERSRISGRLAFLNKIREIFSSTSTTTDEYYSPGQLSILDLSGMDQFLSNYFSYRVLQDIFEKKRQGYAGAPLFIFVEEAHNFVPPGSKWHISSLIRKIASEGRKFGMFLIVITQRPGKIDQDVLSQCNSEIIMKITNPLDQKAVLESGESISETVIHDLPSLNVGEAILTGEFVKFPMGVKVRRRSTLEGGGDIDIISALRESRELRDKRFDTSANMKHVRNLMGDDSG